MVYQNLKLTLIIALKPFLFTNSIVFLACLHKLFFIMKQLELSYYPHWSYEQVRHIARHH